jgi:transcription-repair coupling factor (superfamily II helicase)
MITLFRDRLDRQLLTYPPFKAMMGALRAGAAQVRAEGTQHGFLPLLIAAAHRRSGGASLVLAPTEREAAALQQDLSLLLDSPVLLFPWWGTLPYGDSSPPASVFAERAAVLASLLAGGSPAVVAPLRAVLSPLPPPEATAARITLVSEGDRLDPAEVEARLTDMGYLRVPRVSVHGELRSAERSSTSFPRQPTKPRASSSTSTVSRPCAVSTP